MKILNIALMICAFSQAALAEVNCSGVSTYDKAQTAAVPCEDAKQALAEAKENAKECMSCGAKGEPAADICVSDHKFLMNDLKEHLKLCLEQKKAADKVEEQAAVQ